MRWYNAVNLGLLITIWIIILPKYRSILKARKFWLFFFFIYTLTEFLGMYFSIQHQRNLWLYSISKPIQFLLILIYLFKLLSVSHKKLLVASIFWVAISLAFLLSKMLLDSFHSLEFSIHEAIIVSVCALYFKKIIENEEPVDLGLTEFWFCSSLFIGFGTNLLINGSMDFLLQSNMRLAQKLFYGLV